MAGRFEDAAQYSRILKPLFVLGAWVNTRLNPIQIADANGHLYHGGTEITATAAEINRTCDASSRIVNCTSSTLAVTEASHDGKTITLNRAAGIAVTLPAATGSGARFKFIVGTTVTSNTTTIKVANGSDVMTGLAIVAQDSGDTSVLFETASDTDTITLNGTSTGGIKGGLIEVEDIAANLWHVKVIQSATGTEATPFSATVS